MMTDHATQASLLVIDDDPDICLILRDLLEYDGYRIRTVQSGAHALGLMKEDHFDAVILNLGLPDLDGQAVLQRAKRLNPAMPIIVLSGRTRQDTIESVLRDGAFAFLIKPYMRLDLKTIISEAVTASRGSVGMT